MYEPDKIRTVADIARVQAELRPDAVALACDDLEITYAAFERLTNQCAHALINAGVRPGDRIACLTKNSAEFFVLWFGAAALGDGPLAVVNAVYGFWLVQVIFFAATWALFQHLFGGIKHFIWDSGNFLDPEGREWVVRLNWVLALICTLGAWAIFVWFK